MNEGQAKGYIFESIILKLLEQAGYIRVSSSVLQGRGAHHQIDAHGLLSMAAPFVYPIRMICECKCYRTFPIELHYIRNFVGVIKDISENYFVSGDGEVNTPNRYTDVGCFFSTTPFTIQAQHYAWAHSIYLVTFHRDPMLLPITRIINNYVRTVQNFNSVVKAELIQSFWDYNQNDIILNKTTFALAILNGTYPIVITGSHNWLSRVRQVLQNEDYYAVKTSRVGTEFDTRFNLDLAQERVGFTIPNGVANMLINRIDNSAAGDTIFYIDLPFSDAQQQRVRRIVRINVILPHDDRESFLGQINRMQ